MLAGLTCTSFSVLEALSKLQIGHSAKVLFFFFSTNDPGRQDRTSMLKGLLWQLCETIGIPKPLLDIYHEYGHLSSRGSLNGQELVDVFVQAIRGKVEPTEFPAFADDTGRPEGPPLSCTRWIR